jgi:hypothetical protein
LTMTSNRLPPLSPSDISSQSVAMSTYPSFPPRKKPRPHSLHSNNPQPANMWAPRTRNEDHNSSESSDSSENEAPALSRLGNVKPLTLQEFTSNRDNDPQRRYHGRACMLTEILVTHGYKDKHLSGKGQDGGEGSQSPDSETYGGVAPKGATRRPEFWTSPSVRRVSF